MVRRDIGLSVTHRFSTKSWLSQVCHVCQKNMMFGVKCKHCKLVLTTHCDGLPHVASVVRRMRRAFADRREQKTLHVTFFAPDGPLFPTAHARLELRPHLPAPYNGAADAPEKCIRCLRCAHNISYLLLSCRLKCHNKCTKEAPPCRISFLPLPKIRRTESVPSDINNQVDRPAEPIFGTLPKALTKKDHPPAINHLDSSSNPSSTTSSTPSSPAPFQSSNPLSATTPPNPSPMGLKESRFNFPDITRTHSSLWSCSHACVYKITEM
ncbi:unnamed protein product [Ranitomeya imitator]|uniref:Phorbol-ester/DAG-type domain-containing protein n=1 Tax=Ranitomeya imitator TaxID=111125 RepID=A0ABN9MAD7_9NEOB|nr:unnamed protein product [Ranitomeya imitator]